MEISFQMVCTKRILIVLSPVKVDSFLSKGDF